MRGVCEGGTAEIPAEFPPCDKGAVPVESGYADFLRLKTDIWHFCALREMNVVDSDVARLSSNRSALAFAIPSLLVIASLLGAYVAFRDEALERVTLLFILSPFLSAVGIAGVGPTIRSHLPLWAKVSLLGCHAFAALLAFSPSILLIAMFIFMGGPINPG